HSEPVGTRRSTFASDVRLMRFPSRARIREAYRLRRPGDRADALAVHPEVRDCGAWEGRTDRVGFEPPIPLRVYRFSIPAPSDTRTPVLDCRSLGAGKLPHPHAPFPPPAPPSPT